MLLDKTYSADDFDGTNDAIRTNTLHPVMLEPMHKTRRKARRASARLAYDKAMLKYEVNEAHYRALGAEQQKKTRAPIQPKHWRAPKPPMPTVCVWLSNVRETGPIFTARLGKITVTFPRIPEVKKLVQARDGTLYQIPLVLASQFGGRSW